MITPVSVFEELRFVWELFAAELILLFPFARAKSRVGWRITFSVLILGVCAQFYFMIWQNRGELPLILYYSTILTWYLFLVLLSLLLARYCFSLTFSDAVYIVTAGYSAQHVVYVTVHEVLAKGIMTDLSRYLWLYIILSVLVCTLWYYIVYLLFNKNLSLCGGRISKDTWKGMMRQLFSLVILMVSTFTCQHIFEQSAEMRYYAALLDLLLCTLILANQFSLCRVSLETKEKAILTQMWNDSAHFYSVSKELIETVNRKSHDMKHILNALEHADGEERQRFIDDTRKDIEAYQQVVRTDYEDLNTILSEKNLYCENRGIHLNCNVSDVPEGIVSALDLYILLGNAVDNAIECVSCLADQKKKVITLNAGRAGAFISIQINNYYEGQLKMQDGFPVTSKSGKYYHGFGLKSIRSIAVKYGGDISIDTENGIFSLQIMIPMV